jgi:hypothetical protein
LFVDAYGDLVRNMGALINAVNFRKQKRKETTK